MGFGLIFLGWVTLLFFKVLPVGILGAFLMYKGLSKLCEYSEEFCKDNNFVIRYKACALFNS